MIKKFMVENFKNFKDSICIDFENTAGYQFSTDCVTNGLISKMMIYGRNASGKTNLGNALMNIRYTIFSGSGHMQDGVFLNANGVGDSAAFAYTFQFDDNELIYRYARYSNTELRDEELIIDGKTIFKCDFNRKKYDFDNLKYIDAETANIERYLQSLDVEQDSEEFGQYKLPFLRWLISNVAFKNDSVLIQLANYVKRMIIITVSNGMMFRRPRLVSEVFHESLEKQKKLQDLEDFLNAMGIECKLILKKLPDGRRELYFAHKKLIPFYDNASSGTLALVDLYRRLIPTSEDVSFIYLDEFDAFYHYEMAENLVNFFKRRYPKCQMVITSHNTNLMTNRIMRPDCLFILSRGGTLTALCNATQRELREGHNLEKMYISGEFEKYE